MNIEEKYIKEVKKELENLKKNLGNIKSWNEEIELIKSKINSYNENTLGFKNGGRTFDLNSIIEKDEAKINILKSQINHTEYKLKKVKIYMNSLNEEESKLIELKYLDKDIDTISFAALGAIMSCSKATAKRTYDNAIGKIVKYKYETELKQT
ncbi:MAG: hypothetical protein RR657_01575 [Peptostreptococcaceae bacterium]